MDKESCLETVRQTCKHKTAEDFALMWKKYDADGNGFIEGSELTNFFRDFVKGDSTSPEAALSPTMLKETINQFMTAYDEDDDGKIGMAELAEILQPEENFMLIVKTTGDQRTTAEFEKIWTDFDKDNSGYIESGELKSFLQSLFPKEKKLSEASLEKYASVIIKMLDTNNDNKLDKKELKKLFSLKG